MARPPFVNPDFEYEEDDFEYDDRPAGVSKWLLYCCKKMSEMHVAFCGEIENEDK